MQCYSAFRLYQDCAIRHRLPQKDSRSSLRAPDNMLDFCRHAHERKKLQKQTFNPKTTRESYVTRGPVLFRLDLAQTTGRNLGRVS